MNASYHMIIDHLRPYLSKRNSLIMTDADFDTVKPIPGDESVPSGKHIYFADMASLLKSSCAGMADIFVICVDDPRQTLSESIKCRLILLSPEAGQLCLYNRVLELFFGLSQWEMEMERAISGKKELSDLIQCSKKYLKKPVFVFDYSLHTLADSAGGEVQDPVVSEIKKNGGLPNQYIRTILENNFFLELKKFREVGLFRDDRIFPCHMILKKLNANLLNADCIAMFCGTEPPDAVELDYMSCFAHMVERFLQINHGTYLMPTKSNQLLFTDCIEGKLASEDELTRRAMIAGIAPKGKFSLSCIRFEDFSYFSALYLMEELKSANPYGESFIYKQEVILVNNEQKFLNSEADCESINMRSSDYLKKHGARVGISGICHDLLNLKVAYVQATAAIEIGMLLDPAKYRFRYRDYFIYHVICCASEVVDMRFLYAQRLNMLIKYDKEHNTDNLKLLKTYIMNEFSITRTAEIMHLHRNSVIYRLDKIKQLIGESLENPVFRANVLMSFFTLRLLDEMNRN